MSTLLMLQQTFAQDVAFLIAKAYQLGYKITLGEAWRTPEQAAWNAAHGKGIAHSLHIEKLAIDINLFKADGTLITDGTGHSDLGAWWKAISPSHCWGGDFTSRDYNHYSLTPDGGKTQ